MCRSNPPGGNNKVIFLDHASASFNYLVLIVRNYLDSFPNVYSTRQLEPRASERWSAGKCLNVLLRTAQSRAQSNTEQSNSSSGREFYR